MTAYRGDAYLAAGGENLAQTVRQYFDDKKSAAGADTALEALAAANAGDQDFANKFTPLLGKAGGMALKQKQALLGEIGGYLGQRLQQQQADQQGQYHQAQMANMAEDNRRANQAEQDRQEGDLATAKVLQAYFNPPTPVTDRMGYALDQIKGTPRHLPQALQALAHYQTKPEAPTLPAGAVTPVEGGGRVIHLGGGKTALDLQPPEAGKDYGKARPVTTEDGTPVPGYYWVNTTKGGGQIIQHSATGDTPHVVTDPNTGRQFLKGSKGFIPLAREPVDPIQALTGRGMGGKSLYDQWKESAGR